MTYTGPCIDTDVHHTFTNDADVIAYLPREMRELRFIPGLEAPSFMYPHTYGINKRLSALPSDGSRPGSDYALLREQLLDAFNVERAILSYDLGGASALRNPYFAAALSSAHNDWCVDHWLDGRDPRLFGAALLPTGAPEAAAREIRRMAEQPAMVAALISTNVLSMPLGHPVFEPIYEAAAEVGFPIQIHNGTESWAAGGMMAAGGMPGSRMELMTLANQAAPVHLLSMIVHGVFERHPTLKVIHAEPGVAWLPWFLWTTDSHYAQLKTESPWVKRLPSEYMREHVRISTQPFDVARGCESLVGTEGVDEILCFSSDYPHWDGDDATHVASSLPTDWVEKVMYRNALGVYRWPDRPAANGRVADASLRAA